MKRIAAVVVTLTLAGTIVAAMASAAAAKPLTASQFKKEANAICKAGNEELDAVFEQYFAGLGEDEVPDQATIDLVLTEFIPNIQGQIDDIDALEAPKSLSKTADKFLAAAQDAIDTLDADHSLFLDDELFAKTDKLGKKLGLKACVD